MYSVATMQKGCTVGKVLCISRPESSCIVHCHRAFCDCHLRMEWKPVYIKNGTEVIDSVRNLSRRRLHSVASSLQYTGVLGHAVARRLYDFGWRADAIDEGSSQRLQFIGLLTPVVPNSLDEESIPTKVEKFCQAAGRMLFYVKTQTSGKVHFSGLI